MTDKLAIFASDVAGALSSSSVERDFLPLVREAMRKLVATDDWLPPALAQPHPQHYQQYLLHRHPQGLFSVVSFVWGPGQATPIHDHRVWGAIGMLRGAEENQRYQLDADGIPRALGAATLLEAGQVEKVSADDGDIHRVSNALADRVSISIHVYGGNIGAVKRAVYTPEGQQKPFISGYSNRHLPNIWDLSRENQG